MSLPLPRGLHVGVVASRGGAVEVRGHAAHAFRKRRMPSVTCSSVATPKHNRHSLFGTRPASSGTWPNSPGTYITPASNPAGTSGPPGPVSMPSSVSHT